MTHPGSLTNIRIAFRPTAFTFRSLSFNRISKSKRFARGAVAAPLVSARLVRYTISRENSWPINCRNELSGHVHAQFGGPILPRVFRYRHRQQHRLNHKGFSGLQIRCSSSTCIIQYYSINGSGKRLVLSIHLGGSLSVLAKPTLASTS